MIVRAMRFDGWPKDVARHCFGTYHLAKFRNIQETALEMGHTGVNMLFEHYRGLATKEQGEEFFEIVPAAAAKKVVPFKKVAG